MKRLLIASAVLAVSAALYYFLIHSPGDGKTGAPGTAGAGPGGGGDAASPAINHQQTTINSSAAPRAQVEPYKEIPLPPPTQPPAGWVQPKFAQPAGKLITHPPTGRAPGEAAVARVDVGGETHEVHPNQVGHFERLPVAQKTKVPFTVAYPKGRAGDVIVAVAEDGGSLGKDTVVAKVALDVDLKAAFEFETAGRDGLHRVTVRKGADVKALEFWSGAEVAASGQ